MEKIIITLLKMIAWFPLRALYLFSDFIYLILYYIVRYRKRVVRENLAQSFPEKTSQELLKIEKAYYRFIADIIVETVKLLHISDSELKERIKVSNPEIVEDILLHRRSVVLLLAHYGNWEWVQEISPCFSDNVFKATIYHPLKSRLWDEIYKRIRGRWHAHLLPQKQAVKTLLTKENQPWICGFIADARPRSRKEAARVEFLNHHTQVIYGPEVLGAKLGASFFYLEMRREKRGYYKIVFHPLSPRGEQEPYPITRAFWQKFEEVVRESPAYWLWSHRRWK